MWRVYSACQVSNSPEQMRSNDAIAYERPRLLVLDLLESYARERDINVLLERRSEHDEWVCVLKSGKNGSESRCLGRTARAAIMNALRQEGVYAPGADASGGDELP
jgi:hypothetical protein